MYVENGLTSVEGIGRGLWSLNTIKHRALLENVKLRATKFILSYPQNMRYMGRLIMLNLLPLEYRRCSKYF